MPQLANVVLTDRATTPVNHTFTPKDISGGVGYLVKSTGVPIGDLRMSIANKPNASGRYKPEIVIAVPVVQNETVNGIVSPKVVRTNYVNIKFNFDATSSDQERKDLVGFAESALKTATTVTNAVLVNLEGVY